MPLLHPTKNKGDLAVAKAHADLVEQGYLVCFPATEHAPFDLVAYDGRSFHRVQVKYRTARGGAVTVHFRAVWADSHGTHVRPLDKSEFDVVCVYCPDTGECYNIRPELHGPSVTLRVAPSRNGQVSGVILAESLRSFSTTP